MSLAALFYVNGLLEGATAYGCWNKPEMYVDNEAMDKNGKMYARRFALMLAGFSVSSILMAKQPDNAAKKLFSLGWLVFHVGVALDRGIRDRKLVPVVIHAVMSTGFIAYLYKSGLSKQDLLPQ